jgi:excisionase family DNA binding protein
MPTTGETVRQWARTGRLRAIRSPGGRYKFRREDIDAILDPHDPSAVS